jgi:RHS repeat-associated protein
VVRSALGDGSDDSHTAVGTLVRSAGRRHYSYDGQGRLVRHELRLLNGQRRTWTYSWDAEDRLTAIVTPDGIHWRYLYDPFGRRIAKERSDAAGEVLERADFAWDGTRVAEESSGEQHTTWEYAPDSHRPLAQTTAQDEYDRRFYAIVTDLAGAPTELLDASGDIVWRLRTTLWGAGTPTGGATCPLRFQGQYHDAESGFHYNLERFYDPALARYISPDPLGLDAAPNHHAYVPNPLLWTDPLGLAPACGGAGADNAANYAKQQRYYEQAQKYGKGGVRELESGRFRFYGTIAEARNPGEMVGRRLVREWDPATDATRIWHETVDHAGNVRIVRPDVKVTGGKKVHYVFDALGNFTGTF